MQRATNRKTSLLRAASITLSLLALTACEVGPDFKLPTLDLPEKWSTTQSAAPTIPEATASETKIPRDWWKNFGDPTLTALIEEGLTTNANLLLAASRVAEARAGLNLAEANLYPEITVEGGTSRNKQSARAFGFQPGIIRNDFQLSTVLNYELDLWGRLRRADEAARARLLSITTNRDAIRLAVASDIASGYINLLALDEQIAITTRTIASRTATSDFETKRYKLGAINALTFRQAEAELAAAKALLPQLEQSRTEQENALAVLLGRSPRALMEQKIPHTTALSALPTPPAIPADLPSTLLERRPDIAAAEQDMIAANAEIGQAIADYFPRLSLNSLLGLQSFQSHKLLQTSARRWQIGTSFAAPLIDFGRTTASVDAAKARTTAAEVTYEQTVRTAFAEVLNSMNAITTSTTRVEAEAAQVTARSEAAKIANKRYEVGYANQLEQLDTERNLYAAQLNNTLATRDRLIASITLYKTLGGGWSTTEKQE